MDISDSELRLPPIEPLWGTLADFVAACGCTVQRCGREMPPEELLVGEAPANAWLLEDRTIVVPLADETHLTPMTWAFIAHEAAHAIAGEWSLDDEADMLPWELSVIRRVGHQGQRRAAIEFMCGTGVNYGSEAGVDVFEFGDLLSLDDALVACTPGRRWWSSTMWIAAKGRAISRGLVLDGTIPGLEE